MDVRSLTEKVSMLLTSKHSWNGLFPVAKWVQVSS